MRFTFYLLPRSELIAGVRVWGNKHQTNELPDKVPNCTSLSLAVAENLGPTTLVRHSSHKSSTTHSCHCVSVCSIFMLPNNGVATSICVFNLYTDADACNCTQGLYGHHESLHWKLTLGENNPLLHQGLKSMTVLRLALQLDALPTNLVPKYWAISAEDTVSVYRTQISFISPSFISQTEQLVCFKSLNQLIVSLLISKWYVTQGYNRQTWPLCPKDSSHQLLSQLVQQVNGSSTKLLWHSRRQINPKTITFFFIYSRNYGGIDE